MRATSFLRAPGVAALLLLLRPLGASAQAPADSLLLAAIDSVDVPRVTQLLDEGADPNARGPVQDTPLMRAAAVDSPALVELLLQRGADPTALDQDGDGVLGYYLPPFGSGAEILRLAVAHGADPDIANLEGVTPLMFAVSSGDAALVGALLDAGADADAMDVQGDVAVGYYLSQAEETLATADTLLALGADPDRRNQGDITPLMYAADVGDAHLVRTLLAGGANPLAGDSAGMTALHHAARTGSSSTVPALLDGGLDVDVRDRHGRTPLLIAVGNGHRGTVELLRERGAHLDVEDTQGNHPLIYAALLGQPGMVAVLLNWGLDPDRPGNLGSSALLAAAAAGDVGSVDLLLARGAVPDQRNDEGSTALMAAAESGQADVMEALLEAGADPGLRNTRDKDALQYAEEGGHHAAARLLVDAGVAHDPGLSPAERGALEVLAVADLPAVLPRAEDFAGSRLTSQGPRSEPGGDAYGRAFSADGSAAVFRVGAAQLIELELVASRYATVRLAETALDNLDRRSSGLTAVLAEQLGVPEDAARVEAHSVELGSRSIAYRVVVSMALADVEVSYVAFLRGNVMVYAYGVAGAGDGRIAALEGVLQDVDRRLRAGARLSAAERAELQVIEGTDAADADAVLPGPEEDETLAPGAAIRDDVDLARLALAAEDLGIDNARTTESYVDGAAAGTFTRTWENWGGVGIGAQVERSAALSQIIALYRESTAAAEDFARARDEALEADPENLAALFGEALGDVRLESLQDVEVGELGIEMVVILQVDVMEIEMRVISFLRDRYLATLMSIANAGADETAWLRTRAHELDTRLTSSAEAVTDAAGR